ncbi:MAG: ATP-binding protein [Nitrosopumilaceae archaeon]|nr:ATP-binding protein [Nitrosopumilaceae archaeon]
MRGRAGSLDVIGQVIGGGLGQILVRQKAGATLEIGDILILEERETGDNLVLSVFDLRYASQIDDKMHEMISGVTLEEEEGQPGGSTFYEPDIVNYVIASIRPLARVGTAPAGDGDVPVSTPKALPPFHSTLRPVRREDLAFLEKRNQDGLFVGSIRSGSEVIEDARVMLPVRDIFKHHVLIPATTGRGKSNLVKSMLWNVMDSGTRVGILVLDAHDEYYGKTGRGLKNHGRAADRLVYYTTERHTLPGARTFSINIRAVEPRHFEGIVEFSDAQLRAIHGFYATHGEDWIAAIMGAAGPGGDADAAAAAEGSHDYNDGNNYSDAPREAGANDRDNNGSSRSNDDDGSNKEGGKGSRGSDGPARSTMSVVRRKLEMTLDIYATGKKSRTLHSRNAVFDPDTKGASTVQDIVHDMESGKIVVLDTSQLNSAAELVVGNIVATSLLEKYKYYKTQGTLSQKPVTSIVIEEAPRVIGEDVLASKNDNIYATIAREGRKFQVGLVAVTQLASVIPKAILANMNTKIILGNEMKQEREALIASASQDLSSDDKNIASLDRGEAIITSIFVPFAIPIKVPKFEDLAGGGAGAAAGTSERGNSQRVRVFGQ